MSRLIVDVTGEQHQTIKAMAAMEGKSIREYVLEKILPPHDSGDEDTAWNELRTLLENRIASSDKKGVSNKSVSQITNETLKDLGKI